MIIGAADHAGAARQELVEVKAMGTMRKRRRKKLARAWAEFQDRHDVSDKVMRLVRMMGVPRCRLEEMMAEVQQPPLLAADDRLQELHRRWQDRAAQQRSSRASGNALDRQVGACKRRHDPDWARAKRLCRLSQNDVRMAQALGLKPRALIKNIPSPTQPWKAPVKIWIRELYAKNRRTVAPSQP